DKVREGGFAKPRTEGEDMQRTCHPKISIWKNIPVDRTTLRAGIADLIELASRPTQNYVAIAARIKELVPEYTTAASLISKVSC
ncbi:MAG TPA: hypothetical protein PLT20_12445, partial [Sedimentisphaerales bacterium]|nr:hypothetical protein [Sedimentisphaerales bacterium]